MLKASLAQSTLNEEQIEQILIANGLQGEILETTAEELANAASTNAVAASQTKATGTTLGLGTAFKGLGLSIKSLAVAHPILLALTATAAVIAGVTIAVKKHSEKLEEARQKIIEAGESLTPLQQYNTLIIIIRSLQSFQHTTRFPLVATIFAYITEIS